MTLLATPLAFLVFFSGFAVAQISNISSPNCASTWSWSFNSLNQDPCRVAATMLGTCNGGSFTILPLQPGFSYFGPSGVDDSNLCNWSEFSFNCTKTCPPLSSPTLSQDTRLPRWALLDVTTNLRFFLARGHSSHGGAIAGGVVGGVAVISLLVAGLVFYQRRRRSLESSSAVPLSPGDGSFNAPSPMYQLPRPMSDQGTLASSFPESASLMKPYNPDDPSTYPAFPITPNSSYMPSQGSSNRNLYTVATPPIPQPQGYHGLPTV
ncbi:hypothetical protein BJV77DRAFT_1153326 [Russula vinacea]|nr:hypothetical protein BJV77DRAFT_1153326 [Russula vinacea]